MFPRFVLSFLCLALFAFVRVTTFAQTVELQGRVMFEEHIGTNGISLREAADAMVDVYRTDKFAEYNTKTDKKGAFSVLVPQTGTYIIAVSMPGAEPKFRPDVTVGTAAGSKLEISLSSGEGRRLSFGDIAGIRLGEQSGRREPQAPITEPKSVVPDTASTPQSAGVPLINKDVIALVEAGLSTDIVVAKITASPSAFDTSIAALRELKAAGVTDAIILAMVRAPVANSQNSSVAVSESAKVEEGKSKDVIAAEKIISALRRLDNAIAVGVTFQNYSSLLIENKTLVDENLKDISDDGFRLAVDQTLLDHQYAMSVWNLAVVNGWAVFFTKQEPGRTLVTRYRVPIKISIWTEIPVMTGLGYVWLSARNHFNNATSRLQKMSQTPKADP